MKELLTALTRKTEYGNCYQLDRLKSAARRAKVKLIKQDKQLVAAKAEVAEHREVLEELASCFAHLANDEGSCAANGYFDYNQAIELLAKHKG